MTPREFDQIIAAARGGMDRWGLKAEDAIQWIIGTTADGKSAYRVFTEAEQARLLEALK